MLEKLKEKLNEIKCKADAISKKTLKKVDHLTRKDPLPALGIASVVGALLGTLLGYLLGKK